MTVSFEDIISMENLLQAWQEFRKGKRDKPDVQQFEQDLMENLTDLHTDLAAKCYRHGSYKAFSISDPKPRRIHKASVRDRVLHHAVHRVLYPFYDRKFISDSHSCRKGKGMHRALNRFRTFGNQVSKNNTRTCWVLKCDVRRFFDSVDQEVLMRILERKIHSPETLRLLREIVTSFHTEVGKGLPLGNLTSQLFVNIYMNEFDQFVKHALLVKHYVRYADDFVLMSRDEGQLEKLIPSIGDFLRYHLNLELHPDKVFIKTLASGVDFLGWVHWPDHRVLRTTTKRRMLRRVRERPTPETLQSYLGLLSHGNERKLRDGLVGNWWLWQVADYGT